MTDNADEALTAAAKSAFAQSHYAPGKQTFEIFNEGFRACVEYARKQAEQCIYTQEEWDDREERYAKIDDMRIAALERVAEAARELLVKGSSTISDDPKDLETGRLIAALWHALDALKDSGSPGLDSKSQRDVVPPQTGTLETGPGDASFLTRAELARIARKAAERCETCLEQLDIYDGLLVLAEAAEENDDDQR